MKRISSLTLFLLSLFATSLASGDGAARLSGHVPVKALARAQELGRTAPNTLLKLAIVLNSKDPSGLANTLQSLYDPNDPLYHQFLTADQFSEHFGASDEDVERVSQYLSSRGFSVTNTHSNRLVVDAEAMAFTLENAFQIELHDYLSEDGRIVFAPTSDPVIGDEIISSVNSIAGLHSFSRMRPQFVRKARAQNAAVTAAIGPELVVNNLMTPARIKSVYGINSLSETGAGEVLALFELDGYTSSDIQQYASNFSLPSPTLVNVLVDGAPGLPSSGDDSGATEVTLDIELAMAMAPGLKKIMVYEGGTDTNPIVDLYSKIATDNLANEVSTSWNVPENEMAPSDFSSENTIFQEMATQGQSMFSSSGDEGAYSDSGSGVNTLQVMDPASQPYVTGVGGTTLNWSGSTWNSETSWQTTAPSGTYGQPNYVEAVGGGGGISTQWSLPSWQNGLSTVANKGSSTMRMVPDVSLDADPDTGYPIYYSGGWVQFGGTSCAAPLWAAFTALVNQQRVSSGLSRLGFMNPAIYQVGNASPSTAFHDIADSSTNLYYPAKTGYDLTTGWGTINGTALFNSLVAFVLAPIAPSLTLTPGALSITASWPAIGDATSYTLMKSTSLLGPFSAVASGLTSTSYVDNSVNYGTAYFYSVLAINSAGTGPDSTTQSATPYPPAPGAPSALEASALE